MKNNKDNAAQKQATGGESATPERASPSERLDRLRERPDHAPNTPGEEAAKDVQNIP